MKIGIIGAAGRMGKALIEEVLLHDDCELSGGIVKASSEFAGIDLGTLTGNEALGVNASENIRQLIEESDGIIDFSNPTTTLECAELSAELKKVHIIGTTGFETNELKDLEAIAKNYPCVFAPNMSVGVNILLGLVKQTAALLDTEFDIEIVEMHHCRKIDAPSGTALALGNAAADGRKVSLDDVATKSRDGIIGPRQEGEIGFATLRGGDVVGEHTVIFAGDGERIELTHKASSRKIFAKGAVRASLWANTQKPGFYSMKDVLGL